MNSLFCLRDRVGSLPSWDDVLSSSNQMAYDDSTENAASGPERGQRAAHQALRLIPHSICKIGHILFSRPAEKPYGSRAGCGCQGSCSEIQRLDSPHNEIYSTTCMASREATLQLTGGPLWTGHFFDFPPSATNPGGSIDRLDPRGAGRRPRRHTNYPNKPY